jgi:hypothetical protein
MCARKREVKEYQNRAAGSPPSVRIVKTRRRQRRIPTRDLVVLAASRSRGKEGKGEEVTALFIGTG